ncbi:hypothetical protein ACFLIM_13700 [Nonomuraea sp. M3C6]|uniref:DinB family protein n=1 Tax=Nonomuraea marmarensis TaxID=3351344 RepID=A0ABW7AA91_9ACTN
MATLLDNLLDLSDFAWQRLRTRLEGLTDEEYLWETATDPAFGATPLGWAQWYGQRQAADYLERGV